MRPGRLILILLLSGMPAIGLCAQTEAPGYAIVPTQSNNQHSFEPDQLVIEPVTQNGYLVNAGESPAFLIEFADVRDQTGAGFDHPLLGNDRRNIAVSVFERISDILADEPGSARILIDSNSPWLKQDTLAIGIPFFQCIDGFQKPIIHNAMRNDIHVHSHEGELLVNFDRPLHAGLEAPPAGQYDLYTVLFHEIVHILGFVGFSVEDDGRPQDCGGARMLPAIAQLLVDELGNPLWTEQDGEIMFTGLPSSLPTAHSTVGLKLPQITTGELRLATGDLRVSGHWVPEDFVGRDGVLMLMEPFPSGEMRRNLTPETKSILSEALEINLNQETRGLTGSWVDADLDGQGFTLHFIDESRFAIYYFGFNDQGGRQWMVGLHKGGFRLGEAITVAMFEASGGVFNHFGSTQITESPWGELEIRFLDCQQAEATLSGLDGTQAMNLYLLARVDGLDCY